MSPRIATTLIFFANGAVVGSWVAQIPWIQHRFGLSKATLGLVLAGVAVAVITIVPIAGRAVVRLGSERVTRRGGIAASLAVVLPVLAPHPVLVSLALLVLGAASATMDVAMNSHGVHVEERLGRPIMSSLHAGWAFGGAVGAAFAAALAALGADPRETVAVAAVLLLALVVRTSRALGHGSAAAGDETPGWTWPTRSVLLLAVLCLLTMVTEGAMGDWGGLYLRNTIGSSAAVAALAYTFFTVGMTAGRLVGDTINDRIGSLALLRIGALLTGVPLAALLVIGSPAVALVALFVVGLGVANGVPLMFSAAGRQPGVASGTGIAAVSSLGSLGFLAGPPIIGGVAQVTTLAWGLASLALGAVAVFVLAPRAVGRARPREAEAARSVAA